MSTFSVEVEMEQPTQEEVQDLLSWMRSLPDGEGVNVKRELFARLVFDYSRLRRLVDAIPA